MTLQKVKVRGLVQLSSAMFFLWGGAVLLKGLYDCYAGEPEANLYAPRPWSFVTLEQWARYARFEVAYAAACLALGWLLWRFAGRLPPHVERRASEAEPFFS